MARFLTYDTVLPHLESIWYYLLDPNWAYDDHPVP